MAGCPGHPGKGGCSPGGQTKAHRCIGDSLGRQPPAHDACWRAGQPVPQVRLSKNTTPPLSQLEVNVDENSHLNRALHALVQPKVAASYESIQTQHAHNVILDILADPSRHQFHAQRYAASVIMSITYGKQTPTSYTDPEVIAIRQCITRMGKTTVPGACLVDSFPILRYFPGYTSELRRWREEERGLFEGMVQQTKGRIVSLIHNTGSLLFWTDEANLIRLWARWVPGIGRSRAMPRAVSPRKPAGAQAERR